MRLFLRKRLNCLQMEAANWFCPSLFTHQIPPPPPSSVIEKFKAKVFDFDCMNPRSRSGVGTLGTYGIPFPYLGITMLSLQSCFTVCGSTDQAHDS